MPLDGFFDGQFKSTRRVALGGASREEGDRAALLERAKRDRERRSRLRIETRSAAVVQVFDVTNEVRSMVDQKSWAAEQAANWNANSTKGNAALRFTSSGSTHRTEGYGLDWSSKKQNWFASGDCAWWNRIWLQARRPSRCHASLPDHRLR